MLVKNQVVLLKWNRRNSTHYKSKGYIFTKDGDEFEVNVEDLTPSSTAVVEVECDYCHRIVTKKYFKWRNHIENSIIKKDACKKCAPKKQKESVIKKYGVEHVMQVDSIKEKTKQSNLERYGVTSTAKLPEVQEKIKQTKEQKYGKDWSKVLNRKTQDTLMEKYGVKNPSQMSNYKKKFKATSLRNYGVENPNQSEVVKARIVKTNREKMGYDYPMQSPKVKQKSKNTVVDKYGAPHISHVPEIIARKKATNLKRYGVEFPSQSPIIAEKQRETLYKNGTTPVSNQQLYIHKLIGGELNFPVSRASLDIAFPKEKIFIEYDGGGHDLQVKLGKTTPKEFRKKELKRKHFLRDLGWREIRIISTRDKLPYDSSLIDLIKRAKKYIKSGHSWFEIDIDNSKLRCSQYEKNIHLGDLRRITDKDLL